MGIVWMEEVDPYYLAPYRRAAIKHGAGFRSLLWASARTQAMRFAAFCRLVNFRGRTVADVGCGRADFHAHLVMRGMRPEHYVGIEAVEELAAAAEAKLEGDGQIVRADFMKEPIKLFVGAEIFVFSGSLNTLGRDAFYATLQSAYDATAEMLLFNFLASPMLAAREYLTWHRAEEVLGFVNRLDAAGAAATLLDDYLDGDCTILVQKPDRAA